MKWLTKISFTSCCIFLLLPPVYAQTGWKQISYPTVKQLAAHFKNPPPEYGPTVFWGWNGPIDSTMISREMDTLQSLGFRMITIQAGRGMKYPYLSPGYFKLIRYAVQVAKKKNMRMWLIDDGGYPSGFAGGLFSKKRPDLRMQALIPEDKITVKAGQTISRKISFHVLSAVAYNQTENVIIPVYSGEVKWTAPADKGNWKILLVEHAFRTSATRSVNNSSGAKDTTESLCNYLDPEATNQFIKWDYAPYKKYIGDEFGKTLIGFRSDEPAYYPAPWTPDMLQEFKKQKGYDARPYLASFFIQHPTKAEQRAKADYWDVFSRLYRDHFFKIIADWCKKNNLEYEDHIDKDGPENNETMLALGRTEGDYFKDMRYMQIPGIDVIWHQLWPGEANNFPKLASSAAHLFGKPQAFSESFAAMRPKPDIQQVSWILNEQLVRGINLFEIMYYSASNSSPHGFMASDSFPDVMRALNRKAYLLANGQPTAKIGLFFPTSSLWLRDTAANSSTWRIARQLLDDQRDFDFVDEESLAHIMKLKNDRFINLSGQEYQAIIIPSIEVISNTVLQRLRTFAREGGKVIFMGKLPALLKGKTFLHAKPFPDITWAIRQPTDTITSKILQALPTPDVQFNTPCSAIKYVHRRLKDGEAYFFFNESDRRQVRTAMIKGSGSAQVWDPHNGEIHTTGGTNISRGYTNISLDMAPYGSRIIVLGKNRN